MSQENNGVSVIVGSLARKAERYTGEGRPYTSMVVVDDLGVERRVTAFGRLGVACRDLPEGERVRVHGRESTMKYSGREYMIVAASKVERRRNAQAIEQASSPKPPEPERESEPDGEGYMYTIEVGYPSLVDYTDARNEALAEDPDPVMGLTRFQVGCLVADWAAACDATGHERPQPFALAGRWCVIDDDPDPDGCHREPGGILALFGEYLLAETRGQ